MIQHSVLNFKSDYNSDYLDDTILNLLDKTFVIPNGFTYNIFEVTPEYVARPDLISLDAYGDAQFADIICKLNGISNPFELNEHTKLVIPAPENMMDFYQQAADDEFVEDDDYVLPVVKTKNDKRKANEAIVGDSRFKIDNSERIIIY